MDKQQILSFIKDKLDSGQISKIDVQTLLSDDVYTAYTGNQLQESKGDDHPSKKMINILYAIGAIIAIVGVVILIGQNWREIGFVGRVLVTLGISLMTYLAGLTMKGSERRVLSQILFVISAVLAPVGAYVLIREAEISVDWIVHLIIALILFVIYGTALVITKRNILMFFTVAFATWAYLVTVGHSITSIIFYNSDFIKWAIVVLGISYLFIAYWYKKSWPASDRFEEREKSVMTNIFYSLGTIGILGATISFGGMFDLLFILLIFGAFYGSIFIKSRLLLIIDTLFLIGYIFKLTFKYFVDSIGWPVALIFAGFMVIAVGYLTFYLNKKFISKKANAQVQQQ